MECFNVANTQLQNREREVRHLCGRLWPCVDAQRPDYERVHGQVRLAESDGQAARRS
jgi:hypothetical protein